MPNKPRFEAYEITDLIFGSKPTKMVSMEEVSAQFYRNIDMTYRFLIDGKTVSIEIPEYEAVFHISKLGEDLFVREEFSEEGNEKDVLEPIQLVNWLFRVAPFISIVGYSNI